MTQDQALNSLLKHDDPEVRAAAVILRDTNVRKTKILKLIQETLQQIKMDMEYICFDLEATRRERDEYKAKLEG